MFRREGQSREIGALAVTAGNQDRPPRTRRVDQTLQGGDGRARIGPLGVVVPVDAPFIGDQGGAVGQPAEGAQGLQHGRLRQTTGLPHGQRRQGIGQIMAASYRNLRDRQQALASAADPGLSLVLDQPEIRCLLR